MAVKGVIGITGAELARFAVFYGSLLNLECPEGTVVRQSRGSSVAENRNKLAEYAIEIGAEWIFYVDDDQIIPPDTLSKLLSHDKDIVSAVYLQRQPPFAPLVYGTADERGYVYRRLLRTGEKGLIPIAAAGAGSLLIKTLVFEKIPKPWWTLGQLEDAHDKWCDDVAFFKATREAKIQAYCDLDAPIGHVFTAAAWPMYNEKDGKWLTNIMQDSVLIMQVPSAYIASEPQILNIKDIIGK